MFKTRMLNKRFHTGWQMVLLVFIVPLLQACTTDDLCSYQYLSDLILLGNENPHVEMVITLAPYEDGAGCDYSYSGAWEGESGEDLANQAALPPITSPVVIRGLCPEEQNCEETGYPQVRFSRRAGPNDFRFFNVGAEGSLTLQNVTLVNGEPGGTYNTIEDGTPDQNIGGAIYNQGRLFLIGAGFESNSSRLGGAVYNANGGTIEISGGSFFTQNDAAPGDGGAIYNRSDAEFGRERDFCLRCFSSSLFIENTLFEENTAARGGAIYNFGDLTTTTVFDNTRFVDNRADSGLNSGVGGAIYNDEATLEVQMSEFDSNTAFGDEYWSVGGAIYNDRGNAFILMSQFNANGSLPTANGTFALGGAIYTQEGWLSIENSQFADNRLIYPDWVESSGGAIYAVETTVTITNSVFEGNQAKQVGGAVRLGSAELTIQQSAFIDNQIVAGGSLPVGGGALGINGSAVIENTTFSGNAAPLGAAIHASERSTVTVLYSTVTNNTSPSSEGAALYKGRSLSSGSMIIRYSIVALNPGGDCSTNNAVLAQDENIDSDGSCRVSPAEFSGIDPLLENLVTAGVRSPVHPPKLDPRSPAVDVVEQSSGNCLAEDQLGVVRARVGGAFCDLGAVEAFLGLDLPLDPPDEEPLIPLTTTDTLCWTGPGNKYDVISTIKQGVEVELLGTGAQAGWLVVDNPRYNVPCWLPQDNLEVDPSFDLTALKVFPVPPLPTATFPPPTPCPNCP